MAGVVDKTNLRYMSHVEKKKIIINNICQWKAVGVIVNNFLWFGAFNHISIFYFLLFLFFGWTVIFASKLNKF